MSPLVLATVPKTGSHTMIALLGGQQVVTGSADSFGRAVERGQAKVYFTHTFPENMASLLLFAGRVPFIAPIRHPLAVLTSWVKRAMPDGSLPWGGLAGFVGAFERLFSLDPELIALDPSGLRENVCADPLPRPLRPDEIAAARAIAAHPSLAPFGYGADPW